MPTSEQIQFATLRCGAVVASRDGKYGITYSNRTQAERTRDRLIAEGREAWIWMGTGRVFYVRVA